MSTPNSTEAERLKAEGNALFVKNDFANAYKKYTDALQHDKENAILYCNRAACSLGLNRYIDANTDANKAAELNPKYAKAWGRLAAALMGLGNYEEAVKALKKALDVLPVDNLTSAEEKQRDQYKRDLAAATSKVEGLQKKPYHSENFIRTRANDQLPWFRALEVGPEMAAKGVWNSSAYVISWAHHNWDAAMKAMRSAKLLRTSNNVMYYGRQGVIEQLSNAVVEDSRVFHISDQNWIEMFNNQMLYEVTQTKAWIDSGARDVIEEAPKRLQAEGWNAVRPALGLTVRLWIMRAFVELNLRDNVESALDFYTSAVEVLEWGTNFWKDVEMQDKGRMFEPTFIRGVKCMRLETLMTVYAKEQDPGENLNVVLEQLRLGADEILEGLKGSPEEPEPDNIGFYLAFFRYPACLAHAMRGFHYHHTGKHLRAEVGNTLEVVDTYRKGAMEYISAATSIPMDDERYAWYLHCAFDMIFDVGAPISFMLTILDSMHESIPLMRNIWEFSADRSVRDPLLDKDMQFRENVLRALENGTAQRENMAVRP